MWRGPASGDASAVCERDRGEPRRRRYLTCAVRDDRRGRRRELPRRAGRANAVLSRWQRRTVCVFVARRVARGADPPRSSFHGGWGANGGAARRGRGAGSDARRFIRAACAQPRHERVREPDRPDRPDVRAHLFYFTAGHCCWYRVPAELPTTSSWMHTQLFAIDPTTRAGGPRGIGVYVRGRYTPCSLFGVGHGCSLRYATGDNFGTPTPEFTASPRSALRRLHSTVLMVTRTVAGVVLCFNDTSTGRSIHRVHRRFQLANQLDERRRSSCIPHGLAQRVRTTHVRSTEHVPGLLRYARSRCVLLLGELGHRRGCSRL